MPNKSTIQIKPGVRLIGLNPQIILAVFAGSSIWMQHFPEVDFVITCATDGKHGRGSRHYFGNAIDIRTRTLNADDAHKAHRLLAGALSVEFDVILEPDHIHVEWDPKHGST